jgi:hypothetical protein
LRASPSASTSTHPRGLLGEITSVNRQHRTHIIRVRALVPQIVSFGSSTPLQYSSAGFGPSNSFLQASSAFTLFECGLQSLKLSSSGQQRLQIIRVRALVPRIIFFGLTAPSNYSSAGFGPTNCLLRASSASELLECGLRTLELSSSGQQRLQIIGMWASVPRIVFIGPTAPPNYSSTGFGPSNRLHRANSASELFECRLRSLKSSSSGQ